MKKSSLTLVLLVSILVWRCNNAIDPTNETIMIDIKGQLSEKSLKLDDIAEGIKFIRLETDKNSMIRYFEGYIGEKNIISIDNEKILHFSSDGRFIRTITIKGRGPQEFGKIDAWDVDNDEQFFLFHDIGKNYISKYNLDSQQLENSIPFIDKGYLISMLTVNDTLLIILPNMFSDYGFLYFYQSINGRIIDGLKKEPVPHPGVWAGRTPVLRKADDNSFVFQPSESDTIFKIDRSHVTPLISLLTEKPQTNGVMTKGYYISLLYHDDQRIFLQKYGYEILKSSNSLSILGNEILFFDQKNKKLHTIKPFYHDYFGFKLEIPSIHFSKGTRFFVSYQAMDFKNLLGDAFQKNEIPESQKERLKLLFDQISEYDNPILMTGRIR